MKKSIVRYAELQTILDDGVVLDLSAKLGARKLLVKRTQHIVAYRTFLLLGADGVQLDKGDVLTIRIKRVK